MIKRGGTAKDSSTTHTNMRRIHTQLKQDQIGQKPIKKSNSKGAIRKSIQTGTKRPSRIIPSNKPVVTLPDKTKKPLKKITKTKANLTEQDQAKRIPDKKTKKKVKDKVLIIQPPIKVDQLKLRATYGTYHYKYDQIYGKGTFGLVYKGEVQQTGEIVAVKKVFIDKNFKNRELQIMKQINHPNCIFMRHYFITQGHQHGQQYLNLVMQYVPQTLLSMNRIHIKARTYVPIQLIKIYSFQLFRALDYIHQKQICHRDIKPHNVLIDPKRNRVLLCDFGSAKKLVEGQNNIAYICSRCYRAPQLIFNFANYTVAVDIWSAGCIIAQLINGEPLFLGQNNIDQLVQILKILGTPSKNQVLKLNPYYNLKQYNFPSIKKKQWKKVFRKTDPLLIDLVSKLLIYSPQQRLTARQAIQHKFFDQLRNQTSLRQLRTKFQVPNLFDFSKQETAETSKSMTPSRLRNM